MEPDEISKFLFGLLVLFVIAYLLYEPLTGMQIAGAMNYLGISSIKTTTTEEKSIVIDDTVLQYTPAPPQPMINDTSSSFKMPKTNSFETNDKLSSELVSRTSKESTRNLGTLTPFDDDIRRDMATKADPNAVYY